MEINFEKWRKLIRKPDWYFTIVPELKGVFALKETEFSAYAELKKRVYDFFEKELTEGSIALGQIGKNWDSARKPIDSVIIHHTKGAPGLTHTRLSAIELVRLYAPYYAEPYDEDDFQIKGQPIYSGHFREGVQNFWPYHWLIRSGGKAERLLYDQEIGWQAGNWDINCRSVAIAFDNNYENTTPPEEEIKRAASIIREYYSYIQPERIFGHCEINTKTLCPSILFLDGWKKTLLESIKNN